MQTDKNATVMQTDQFCLKGNSDTPKQKVKYLIEKMVVCCYKLPPLLHFAKFFLPQP